jgi:hypothetical protein
MPQRNTWGRLCQSKPQVDHVALFSDDMKCTFCGLWNPTPPEPIAQSSINTGVRLRDGTISLDTDEEGSLAEESPSEDPSGLYVTEQGTSPGRFSATLGARTIANPHRQRKAHQVRQQEAKAGGPVRNAGSAPISQAQEVVATVGKISFEMVRLNVQCCIGRYREEGESADSIKKFTWRAQGMYAFFLYLYAL